MLWAYFFDPEIIVYQCSHSYMSAMWKSEILEWIETQCLLQIEGYRQIIYFKNNNNQKKKLQEPMVSFGHIKLPVPRLHSILMVRPHLDLQRFNLRSTGRLSAFHLGLFAVLRNFWERFKSSQTPELSGLLLLCVQTPALKYLTRNSDRIWDISDIASLSPIHIFVGFPLFAKRSLHPGRLNFTKYQRLMGQEERTTHKHLLILARFTLLVFRDYIYLPLAGALKCFGL